MSISGMRAGLASNLSSIPGLRVASEIPDQINPPVAVIALNNIEYDGAFQQGLTTFNFTIQLVVTRMAERRAQERLDLYSEPRGEQSVKSAIESDRTLGGNASDVRVESRPSVGSLQVNDQDYLAADFSVVVYV